VALGNLGYRSERLANVSEALGITVEAIAFTSILSRRLKRQATEKLSA
jgi:hypothetical protein